MKHMHKEVDEGHRYGLNSPVSRLLSFGLKFLMRNSLYLLSFLEHPELSTRPGHQTAKHLTATSTTH